MKGEVTSEGILKVIPENNIEDYALKQWMKNFNAQTSDAILQIGRRPPCPQCENCTGQFFCHSCGRRLITD